MPESPRWLVKEGHKDNQRAVIKHIYKEENFDLVNERLNEEVSKLIVET
jgi:hypothetical protein